MSDAGVQVALITTAGAVLVALLGVMSAVLVELIRNRKQRATVDAGIATVVAEVTPNGSKSMKDQLGRIEVDVQEIKSKHGARLATLEARLSDHLLIHGREG